MKVIGAKIITRHARAWLLEHQASIERHHGLWIVFLPETLVLNRASDARYPDSIMVRGWQKLPLDQQRYYLLVEPGDDEKRTIYSAWRERNEI
jgi:hypothetical protein